MEGAARTPSQRREQGLRPLAPAYAETPLLTLGKEVRVQVAPGKTRRATIECIDEVAKTVEILYKAPNWVKETEEAEEATVPADSLRPLEPFEVSSESTSEDLGTAASRVKDQGNVLFKLGDFEAAGEWYGKAIAALQSFKLPASPDTPHLVLVNRAGVLTPGRVLEVEADSQRADVSLRTSSTGGQRSDESSRAFPGSLCCRSRRNPAASDSSVVSGAPWRALIQVHQELLPLHGSLLLNRARALSQVLYYQEAAQDLSLVIALWSVLGLLEPSSQPPEQQEQLTKALYLRAKTRLSRMRIEPARQDLQAAWALSPPEATADLLRRLEREIDQAQKEKVRSNKKLAKEIAKFADNVMSGLDESQLAALGSVAGSDLL